MKAGERVGNLWIIDEGLNPGDRVVVEGLQKVRDGMTVSPKPVPPEPETQQASMPAAPAVPATPTAAKPGG